MIILNILNIKRRSIWFSLHVKCQNKNTGKIMINNNFNVDTKLSTAVVGEGQECLQKSDRNGQPCILASNSELTPTTAKLSSKHKKISVEFYNLLNTHPTYIQNWRAIYPAFIFLKEISRCNRRTTTNGGFSEYSSKKIQKIFNNARYTKYVIALQELDLLLKDDNYSIPTSSKAKDGHCKAYKVTNLGNSLLYSSNLEYLKLLHKDKNIIRLNQKAISQSGIMNKEYGDYLLDYIHDGLKNMTFNYEEVIQCLENSDKSIEDKVHITNILIKFKEKKFTPLKRNVTDNRIWNEFVGMMSDFRQFFKYKNMDRTFIVDIRACHPTFWSSYILNHIIKSPASDCGAENHPELLSIHHNVHLKADKSRNRLIYRASREHEKWVKLFTNEVIDPRTVMLLKCGYVCESDVKVALSETINGSNSHPKLLKWIETEFPVLYSFWRNQSIENIKKTGNMISTHYETILMQNEQLYKMCELLDIKLTHEYDGFSIYCAVGDDKALDKVSGIVDYLKIESKKVFGIDLICKIKTPVNEMIKSSSEYDKSNDKNKLSELYHDIHQKYIKLIRKTNGGKLGTYEQKQKLWVLKEKNDYLKTELYKL